MISLATTVTQSLSQELKQYQSLDNWVQYLFYDTIAVLFFISEHD